MPFELIDTHVHIWDLEKVDYPWLKGNQSILNRTYQINELSPQLTMAGVTKGILVQASNNAEDTVAMLQVSQQEDWIEGVVGWLPLMDPITSGKTLTQYQQHPYFKGVRHLIHDEPDTAWLLQPTVIESLTQLANQGLTYDLVGINNAHIETALAVAEKIPHLKMVFDHLNQPPIQQGEKFGAWGAFMSTAASNPHFYAKFSGLGTTCGTIDFTKDSIKPYLEFIIQQFGVDRCFCGGDWPVSLLAKDYTSTWQIYQAAILDLVGEHDAQKIFATNAIAFYHLNPTQPTCN
ncbi:MAG: amidohydrolase [Chitinophagaceae bacterium BSSC1]|nr:MAG: amidohydrolase [Chitinophagaceae bacterium BSSC1]